MLERIQVVPGAEIHGRHEVPPELEEQWWQLEREIARSDGGSAGKLPHRHSSRPWPVAVRPRRSTDQHRSNAVRTELLMSHKSLCSRRGRACRRKLYATSGSTLEHCLYKKVDFAFSSRPGEPRRYEQPAETSGSRSPPPGPSGSSSAPGRCRRPRSTPTCSAHGTRGVRSPLNPA
jgi:hypothetical protein